MPNLLGIGRILAAPVVAACIFAGALDWAFTLFLLAGLSDALDGAIARRFDAVTAFGAFLDPMADKLLVNAAYLSAAAAGLMPAWLAALVFARDGAIALVATASRLAGREAVFPPAGFGKINTGLQVGFGCYILAAAAFAWPPRDAVGLLAFAVAAATLLSGAGYAVLWLRRLRQG